MRIDYLENTDWEPLLVRLIAPSVDGALAVQVEKLAGEWMANRDLRDRCKHGCMMKFVGAKCDHGTILLLVQWACKECVEKLLQAVANSFPQIGHAIIGYPAGVVDESAATQTTFVSLPGRRVVLGDGSAIQVQPFEISLDPIRVRQYHKFCALTGYRTSAELAGSKHTYCDNGTLFSEERRRTAEAHFLSYLDGAAYCSFHNLRLPTEAELLAAMTVDDDVRDLSPEDRAALYRDSPRLIRSQGKTLTSTLDGDKVVTRSGPWVIKHPGWEGVRWYRALRGRNDAACQLYVVKTARSA